MKDILVNDPHLLSLTFILLNLLLWRAFPKATAYKWLSLIGLFSVVKHFFIDLEIEASSFLHIGMDLMLVALISVLSGVFNSSKAKLVFIPFGLFALFFGHQSIKNYIGVERIDQSFATVDVDGELLVELVAQENQREFLKLFDNIIKQVDPLTTKDLPQSNVDEYFVLDLKDGVDLEAAINKILESELVVWAEPNQMFKVPDLTSTLKVSPLKKSKLNDPLLDDQWISDVFDLDKMHKRLSNKKTKNENKALIAILDTGVDANHEDLKANFRSFNYKDNTDPKGHGTHCAGIAAAVSNNNIGIASLVPDQSYVDVTSIKVLNRMGMGTQAQIIRGIIKAADIGADVISLSLGSLSSEDKEKAYKDAIDYALKKNAIVVAAAGNSAKNAKFYSPANTPGIITVAAVGRALKLAPFSNTVEDVEMGIAAPGVDILSTLPSNKYGKYNGTSMAAPFIAGLLGLMKSIKPELNNKEAFEILKSTAIKKYDQIIVNPDSSLDYILSQ